MTRRLWAFVRLSRLKFLVGGFAGGAFGTAIAYFETHAIDLGAYALSQTAITAAHLMTHYANDFFDIGGDARTIRTPYSGGSGVLTSGLLHPRVALGAALVCLCASLAGAAALAARGQLTAAVLALSVVALAWSYSAPPLRLSARGLGELDTALVVAILVPLCAYAAQTGGIDARAVASTLPGAAAMIVMMVCVQMPDLAADAATGKRNLAVRLGERRVVNLAVAALAAQAIAVVLAVCCGAPLWYAGLQASALVPVGILRVPLRAMQAGIPWPPADLAARGVALFATVSIAGVAGYLCAALL